MNRQEHIARLRRFPTELEALVTNLSQADLHTPYMAQEWTVAQNVHHLADSHMMAFGRTKLMLTSDAALLVGYAPDAWSAQADEIGQAIESSLAILRGLHQRWADLFESLSDADFARTGQHTERGTISVEDILHSYSAHCDAHIEQIQRTLAAKA